MSDTSENTKVAIFRGMTNQESDKLLIFGKIFPRAIGVPVTDDEAEYLAALPHTRVDFEDLPEDDDDGEPKTVADRIKAGLRYQKAMDEHLLRGANTSGSAPNLAGGSTGTTTPSVGATASGTTSGTKTSAGSAAARAPKTTASTASATPSGTPTTGTSGS